MSVYSFISQNIFSVFTKQQYCDVSPVFRKFRTKEEGEKSVFQVLTVSHVQLFPGQYVIL